MTVVAGTFRACEVEDPAGLAALFRVRHEVYRLDMGLSVDAEGTTEQDAYDAHAIHVACVDDTGKIAGYARLIHGVPDLPTVVLYDLERRYVGPAAEVSRLIVAPAFRHSEVISRLVRAILFDVIERHAAALGVVNLFSLGRPALFTLLRGDREGVEQIEGARPVNLHLFGPMYRDFFARGEVVAMRLAMAPPVGAPS